MAAAKESKLPKYSIVPLSTLIPYANNSRTHSEAQVDQIAASMKEFGFTSPILTDGANGILAGHGRVLAAKKLGLTVVPVIDLGHLSEAQRKAYVIADNKLAENAGWDKGMLALEIERLQELDFDLSITGFSIDELEALHDDGDRESLNAGGDNSTSGTEVARMTFGKAKVELSDDELERLETALEQYLDAHGGTSGFASYLLEGGANA